MLVRNKLYSLLFIFFLVILHLASEYLRGGVVTHYPLADASNPPLSNWWGLITIPALTWALLTARQWQNSKAQDASYLPAGILLQKNYLFGGVAFGLVMGLLWELGQEEILQYLILLLWVAALFIKIYLPETTLGFVLGMMYTFGGVLPIAFAFVIQTVGYIIYKLINRGGKWLLGKVTQPS